MARIHAVVFPDQPVKRVPFTPEEESARDAIEAAWAADQATRDAEAAREVQREARIKELARQQTTTRAENEEFINLLRERERD